MSDWKRDLMKIKETTLTNKATPKGDNNMSEKITVGIKFTEQYGLRIDAGPFMIGKKAVLLIDRVAGKLALKFDADGNTFAGNNNNAKSMITFGQRHLGNIKRYTSEFTKYDAIMTADGLFINGFELPRPLSKPTRNAKPKMGRSEISRVDEVATIGNLKHALREANRYGKQLGVEWGIEDGKVVGNINVKRKI